VVKFLSLLCRKMQCYRKINETVRTVNNNSTVVSTLVTKLYKAQGTVARPPVSRDSTTRHVNFQ